MEDGEINLQQQNKNINKKSDIYVNSDIEGFFEFFPKLFVDNGLFLSSFKDKFKELWQDFIEPKQKIQWQDKHPVYNNCTYFERFLVLAANMVKAVKENPNEYLNKDFDKQIILCGDLISRRCKEHYEYNYEPADKNDKKDHILYLNFLLVDFLSSIKQYLQSQDKNNHNQLNEQKETLDNHSLILLAGNHELYSSDKDKYFDDCMKKFIKNKVLQPYYVTNIPVGDTGETNEYNTLIFKHAPYATEKQYKEMMANNVPDYLGENDLKFTGFHIEKLNQQELSTLINKLTKKNLDGSTTTNPHYGDKWLTANQQILDDLDEEEKKILEDVKTSANVFNEFIPGYVDKFWFYYGYCNDDKWYPLSGKNYFNSTTFKTNKKVLLIHGHTHEGQYFPVISTELDREKFKNEKKLSFYHNRKNKKNEDGQLLDNAISIAPGEMEKYQKDFVDKERRFCVDNDLYTKCERNSVPQLKTIKFSKNEGTRRYNQDDCYLNIFHIGFHNDDKVKNIVNISALHYWGETLPIYWFEDVFKQKVKKINNEPPYCCGIPWPCCSCGCDFLSCG